jgi:hypothetical protein
MGTYTLILEFREGSFAPGPHPILDDPMLTPLPFLLPCPHEFMFQASVPGQVRKVT